MSRLNFGMKLKELIKKVVEKCSQRSTNIRLMAVCVEFREFELFGGFFLKQVHKFLL